MYVFMCVCVCVCVCVFCVCIHVPLSYYKMESCEPDEMVGVAGGLVDVEAMLSLKDLFNRMGSEGLFTEESFPCNGAGSDLRSSYLLNSGINGIEVREGGRERRRDGEE